MNLIFMATTVSKHYRPARLPSYPGRVSDKYHSISIIVPGSFEVGSCNTLETPLTSCMILDPTFSMKSGGNLKDLAVICRLKKISITIRSRDYTKGTGNLGINALLLSFFFVI